MESIKHLLELPNKIVDKIRDTLLSEVETKILDEEIVLFMDTEVKTLYLKLNASVDRVCKIRNKLLPNAKESFGSLYTWTKSTVSTAPPKETDYDMEFKRIDSWLKQEGWEGCESQVHPSDDILLAAEKNCVIEKLIDSHKPGNTCEENNQKKLVFVRATDELVNYSKYLQKLILFNSSAKEVLIITHMPLQIAQDSFIPTDEAIGAEIQVMSAFKPSTKQGISTIVISVCPKLQQHQQTNTGISCNFLLGIQFSHR
jgi:hypothetical protein